VNLYSIGYNGMPPLKPKDIVHLVGQYESNAIPIVVDIRESRGARRNKAFDLRKVPRFGTGSGKAVGEVIPDCRYVWCQTLGNPSRKLPWEPTNREGAQRTIEVAAKHVAGLSSPLYVGPVILLCGCAKAAKCHRTPVAEAIADEIEKLTGERPRIVHLEIGSAI
jgi:hypothetical protein